MQSRYGTPHGKQVGFQDVQAVDLLYASLGNAPCHGALTDEIEQDVPFARRQLLGVIQPRQVYVGRQDTRGGDYGSAQRSASRLVHTAHGVITGGTQLIFQ